jgi:hypothetical protein
MTEVFKTDVTNKGTAKILCVLIERAFPGYLVNFDLDDCDRVLRVVADNCIDDQGIIHILSDCGISAEVLPDEIPSISLPSVSSPEAA